MSAVIAAAKTPYGRYMQCARKTQFKTRHRALRVAKLRGWHSYVYECPICGRYHLTHKKVRV